MSGSDGNFPPSSLDPSPSHPAGLAIARGSSAPRGPRGRPCVRTSSPRSERRGTRQDSKRIEAAVESKKDSRNADEITQPERLLQQQENAREEVLKNILKCKTYGDGLEIRRLA